MPVPIELEGRQVWGSTLAQLPEPGRAFHVERVRDLTRSGGLVRTGDSRGPFHVERFSLRCGPTCLTALVNRRSLTNGRHTPRLVAHHGM